MASETCEITELLRILNKRNQLLVKVWLYFTLGLGIVLSLFGLIAWPFLASTLGPLSRLMFPPVILCAALVLPRLFLWIFRLALPVPRCPECGARMESLSPALRRCPKCRRVVARDSRSLLPGYQLPTDEKSLRVRDPEEAISVGTVAVRVGSFLLCAIPIVWVGSFYLGSSFPETGSVEAGTWIITAGGVLVFALYFAAVAFQRAAPKLVEWIDRKCDRLNRHLDDDYRGIDPDPAHRCPHCGREPDHALAAVTGNCSHCGGPIRETAVEPEQPELMEEKLLHRYTAVRRLDNVFYLLLPAAVVFAWICAEEANWDWAAAWGLGAIALGTGYPLALFALRRRWRIVTRCPFCGSRNSPWNSPAAWRFLLQTGHCANCRRKLVRTGPPPAK